MAFFRALAVSLILLVALTATFGAQAPVSSASSTSLQALQDAVRSNNLAAVQKLLAAGVNPSVANRYGVTPLSLAADNANSEMVAALLKAGADAKAMLPGGQTLVMSAARTGNAQAVKLLLDRGVDPNAKESTNGETALMWAAAENHPEAVKMLVAHGASLNVRSSELTYKTDRFGLEGVVTILPKGNWTALMYAAREGSTAAVQALAEAGADLNLTDPDGTSAMVIAIINAQYDAAAMLVKKGADPEVADSAGMAALFAATDMNTLSEIYGRPQRKSTSKVSALELMKILLDAGAKPNTKLKGTTLQRVHTPGDRNVGVGATPLMRAARNGDAAGMRLLLSRGADPTLAQPGGVTALMLAAGLGRGLGVFADEYATDAQMLEAVKILLEQHVNVNAASDTGQTALHYAALSMDDVVELLVKNGANIDAADKQGRTPMDMARGKGGPGRAGAVATPRLTTIELLHKLGSRQP